MCHDEPPGAGDASPDMLLYYIKYVLIVDDLISSESNRKGGLFFYCPAITAFTLVVWLSPPFHLFLHKHRRPYDDDNRKRVWW